MAANAVVGSEEYETELKRAFPQVAPNMAPAGSRVLVQIKTPPKKVGSILLSANAIDTERDNTTVGIVVSMGPLAFKKRDTMEEWPEGKWCEVGDFVFIPKYGGQRFRRDNPDDKETPAEFGIFEDMNVIAKVDDPLSVRAFV